MDAQNNKRSAIDHLDSITFKVGLKGYNVDEVDEFLEKLSGEVNQLKDMVSQLRQQLRVAQERGASGPATGPVPTVSEGAIQVGRVASSSESEAVTSMIAMAQQFVEKAKVDAEAKARELMSAAQERSRELVADAKSRAEDEVARLNGLKQRLGEDIDTLSDRLESERARLTTVVVEFSRWIEGSFKVNAPKTEEPAAASKPAQGAPSPDLESFVSDANSENLEQEPAPTPPVALNPVNSAVVPPAALAPAPEVVEERKSYNASAGTPWPPKPLDRQPTLDGDNR
jgi:DivIVA domain-containing protein